MDIKSRKQALRKQIAMTPLPAPYIREASSAITNALLSSELYRNAGCIFCYVSTSGEPSTSEIIARALKDGKILCVPKCIGKGIMKAIVIPSPDCLQPGLYGIPEPPEGLPEIGPEAIELAIIPCLAATRDGIRLGHGGGYYDRFLARTKATKAVLCFSKRILPAIPEGEQDVRMDVVFSED